MGSNIQRNKFTIIHHKVVFQVTLIGHYSANAPKSCPTSAEDMNLCSQAVSELHLLAGDTIFNTTSKVLGMYMMAAGAPANLHFCVLMFLLCQIQLFLPFQITGKKLKQCCLFFPECVARVPVSLGGLGVRLCSPKVAFVATAATVGNHPRDRRKALHSGECCRKGSRK